MKLSIMLDLERSSRALIFVNHSRIILRFTHCHYSEFYDWFEKNHARIITICAKWDWTWDVGHADKVIQFSKI